MHTGKKVQSYASVEKKKLRGPLKSKLVYCEPLKEKCYEILAIPPKKE